MNNCPDNPSCINDGDSRCAQYYANGKRCRLPVRSNSEFCVSHAKANQAERDEADLTAVLTGGIEEFDSAAPINRFLSRLLLLLAQDRISPRRAAVMAYTSNLLLHTVSAIGKENAPAPAKHVPTRVIWNIPGPPREQDDVPDSLPDRAPAPQLNAGTR